MKFKKPLKLGDEIEIEICPTEGQYEATTTDGQPFVEKFSLESVGKVVANWEKDERKPILCDIDHSSVDTGKTSAAGWVLELKVDADAKRLKGILVVSEKGVKTNPKLLFSKKAPLPDYAGGIIRDTDAARRARKKAWSLSRHSSPQTPPMISARWMSASLSSMPKTDCPPRCGSETP